MKGRPAKTTVDYFPHMTTSGKTIFTMESLFGNDGYAFWFKLLEILGSTSGHSFDYNNPADWVYLLAVTRVDEKTAENMLKTLADLDAIDAKLFSKKIIWSDNFVMGLLPVYDKRSTEIPVKPTFRGEKGISGEKIPQSKVKHSKGEQSKELYGSFSNVLLTKKELGKLEEKFNGSAIDKIDNLSEYIASKGAKYKSHYATILAWERKNKKQDNVESSGKVIR